jgi:uncharacterized protein YbjT (DUF2867 family)
MRSASSACADPPTRRESHDIDLKRSSSMRTYLSAPSEKPVVAIAGTAAYMALITLVITLITTSDFVAAVAGALTVGLLVGSYLLERWARRRTLYTTTSRPSPSVPTEDPAGGPQTSDVDESRMAKI